jgi:hypothetical protein
MCRVAFVFCPFPLHITGTDNYYFFEKLFPAQDELCSVKRSPDDGRSVVSQHGLGSVSHIVDVDLMKPWVQSLGYDKK